MSELFSALQYQAIAIGLREGGRAHHRTRHARFLRAFLRPAARPLADAGLDALRRYAEMARLLFPGTRADLVSALSLAGFSQNQIIGLNRLIAGHVGDAK